MEHDTTLLFGLPGVRVRHVERSDSGDRTVHVETADESAAGCPLCGVVSTSVNGYVTTTPCDTPYGEAKIAVVWHERRWRCRSVAEAAASYGMSWPTAHIALTQAADASLTEPEPVAVLGIEETRRGKPGWARDSETGGWGAHRPRRIPGSSTSPPIRDCSVRSPAAPVRSWWIISTS